MVHRQTVLAPATALLGSALLCSFQSLPSLPPAVAQPVDGPYVRVVDTSATMPGQSFPFTGFRSACIDGRRVAFHGGNFLFAEGLYLFEAGRIVRVVDSTMDIPGLPPGNPFVGFSDPSLDGRDVAFLGARNVGLLDYEGIFVGAGASLVPVVEKRDPVPGSPGFQFFFLFPPSMSGGDVTWTSLVTGPGPDRRGIYSSLGGVHTVVDDSDPMPGTESNFADFSFNPTVGAGAVGFTGGLQFGLFRGAYGHDTSLPAGQETFVVADVQTLVPGTNQPFTMFYDGVTARASHCAFRADGAGRLGVYASAGGALVTVADTATPVPGAGVPFTGFNQWSQHGPALNGRGDVAFVGESARGKGIYARYQGTLRAVVEAGDLFDQRIVSYVDLGREGFDGRRLAFALGFTDGSAAVYVLTL